MDIAKIESEIQQILTTDRSSWMRVSELITYVETNKAWRDNFQSFSAWIRHLAAISKVHESIIWQRKKAGEIYRRYQDRATRSGKMTPKMSEIQVSPENLILAEKIGQGVGAATDGLIDKILDGELKRSELKSAWQSVKRVREENGEKASAVTRHDIIEVNETALIASDISIALTNSGWIRNFSSIYNPISTIHGKRIYRAVPEFPVLTGSSRDSRRIDLLVAENYTLEKPYNLNTHAIKIEVSQSDLKSNHKASEYSNIVDFIWVAVPSELSEVTIESAMQDWGIIAIDENHQPKIIRRARRNNVNMGRRIELLQTFVIREC